MDNKPGLKQIYRVIILCLYFYCKFVSQLITRGNAIFMEGLPISVTIFCGVDLQQNQNYNCFLNRIKNFIGFFIFKKNQKEFFLIASLFFYNFGQNYLDTVLTKHTSWYDILFQHLFVVCILCYDVSIFLLIFHTVALLK